jgi:hypothetical protein
MRTAPIALLLAACSSGGEIAALKHEIAGLQRELADAKATIVDLRTTKQASEATPPAQKADEPPRYENASGDKFADAVADADEAGPLTYAQLKKSPDSYFRPWAFTGQILEIHEHDGETTARLTLSMPRNEVVWVSAGFVTPFVELNIVDVVGTLIGTRTYNAQSGARITIPKMVALGMQKRGAIAKARAANKKRLRTARLEAK